MLWSTWVIFFFWRTAHFSCPHNQKDQFTVQNSSNFWLCTLLEPFKCHIITVLKSCLSIIFQLFFLKKKKKNLAVLNCLYIIECCEARTFFLNILNLHLFNWLPTSVTVLVFCFMLCVDHIWDQLSVFILFTYIYKGFVTLNSYRGTLMVGGGGRGGKWGNILDTMKMQKLSWSVGPEVGCPQSTDGGLWDFLLSNTSNCWKFLLQNDDI